MEWKNKLIYANEFRLKRTNKDHYLNNGVKKTAIIFYYGFMLTNNHWIFCMSPIGYP
jgi:hypothetical protein